MARRTGAMVVGVALLTAACGADAGVQVQSAVPIDRTENTPLGGTGGSGESSDARPGGTDPTVPPTSDAPVPTSPEATSPVTDPTIPDPQLDVEIPFADVVDVDPDKPARDHDAFVAVAFTDIERWWGEVFDDVYGVPFEPLAGGIFAGYPERESPIPGCGERETSYDDLRQFVAFYCNLGDFIAYDDGDDPDPRTGSILTPLADAFGSAVMGVVLAHEYGHAIQERSGALDRPLATILTEQQADCFAGAWTGQAYRGESPLLRLGDGDVRAGLLAMLEVRDPVGVNQFTPGGHGSAFDRVGAFQVGFLEGPARCAQLLDDPLPLMPNEFTRQDDFERGGNASYDCSDDPNPDCTPAPEFLAEDINHFWQITFDGDFEPIEVFVADTLDAVTCADARVLTPQLAICPADRSLIYVEPAVVELYDELGDFILGYLYGIATAEFAQEALGSGLSGEPRALLDDCLTGAWVRDITPDDAGNTPRAGDRDGDGVPDTVTSSPGDLDEAIQMAILLGDLGADVDRVGTAFEKIDAFRNGVLNGLPSCLAGVDLTP